MKQMLRRILILTMALLCVGIAVGQDYVLTMDIPYSNKYKDDVVIKNNSGYTISVAVYAGDVLLGEKTIPTLKWGEWSKGKVWRSHNKFTKYQGSKLRVEIECAAAKQSDKVLLLGNPFVHLHDFVVSINVRGETNNRYPSVGSSPDNSTVSTYDKQQRRRNFWNKFADITEAAVTVMEGVGSIYETYHTQDDNTSASGYSSTGTYASSGNYASSSGSQGYKKKKVCHFCKGSGYQAVFNSSHHKNCKLHFCTKCYAKHCLDHNIKHEKCSCDNGFNIVPASAPIKSTCSVCDGSGYVRDHSYYPICNKVKCTKSSYCPLCHETHCLDHEKHKICPSCNGELGIEGEQSSSASENASYSASDNLNHVLGKCYYCDGTGACQDCRDCYFVDSKGHRYGATEKYWFSNISKFVCTLCKGSKIDGNHRCTLCFEIVTAPDGSTWGMRNDVWKTDSSASGILCYTCDGTMKCVYCKGTGKR